MWETRSASVVITIMSNICYFNFIIIDSSNNFIPTLELLVNHTGFHLPKR